MLVRAISSNRALPNEFQASSFRFRIFGATGIALIFRGLTMKFRALWLGIFLTLSLAGFGQDSASITGTVTDQSGAAVPNAEVTVSSADRGINRPTTTNSSGDYLVAGLPSGPVNVVVMAQGFKKYEAKGVVLQVGQKARADVSLDVGTNKEEVTVEGTNVAQVETQSSDLAGTVNGNVRLRNSN